MTIYTKLALHTLIFNRKQYISLFTVVVLSVAVMLCALSICDGMLSSLSQKAKLYYGGDLQLMCGGKSYPIDDPDKVIDIARKYVPQSVSFYKRFDFDASHAALFFQGESVRQRMFKGVDFEKEADIFSTCNFTSGDATPSENHDTIVISAPIAKKLGANVKDKITLQVVTVNGYINTIDLIVSGISTDTSLFGMYTSYIDILALQKVTGQNAGYVNRICMYFNSNTVSNKDAKLLHAKLANDLDMYKLTDNKDEFTKAVVERNIQYVMQDYAAHNEVPELDLTNEEELEAFHEEFSKWYKEYYDKDITRVNGNNVAPPLFALITLDANTKDLQMLIDAMKAIVIVIIAFLVAIISVGVASTYRVIVIKRTVEIGTYRAIGMVRGYVRMLFMVESLYLLLAGFIVGVALSFLMTRFASVFNLQFIPAFDMFLTQGHLSPVYNIAKVVLLLGIICITTILSVLWTLRKIIHISPVSALATTA